MNRFDSIFFMPNAGFNFFIINYIQMKQTSLHYLKNK